MELIIKLANFASSLEKAGLSKHAKKVDTINNSFFRVAQYVGLNGVWIRQERCWAGCYRHKRATEPLLPAQKVWENCQKEYQKSLTGNTDEWDKYASNDNFVKMANYTNGISEFDKKLKLKIASGLDVGQAILSISQDAIEIAINNAFELSKIAETIDNKELSKEAYDLSAEIIKEAGLWDGIKNVWQGIKNKAVDIGQGIATSGKITNLQNQLKKEWKTIVDSLDQFNQTIAESNQYFQQKLQSRSPSAIGMSQQAINILKQINRLRINKSATESVANLLLQLDGIVSGIVRTDIKPQNTVQNTINQTQENQKANTTNYNSANLTKSIYDSIRFLPPNVQNDIMNKFNADVEKELNSIYQSNAEASSNNAIKTSAKTWKPYVPSPYTQNIPTVPLSLGGSYVAPNVPNAPKNLNIFPPDPNLTGTLPNKFNNPLNYKNVKNVENFSVQPGQYSNNKQTQPNNNQSMENQVAPKVISEDKQNQPKQAPNTSLNNQTFNEQAINNIISKLPEDKRIQALQRLKNLVENEQRNLKPYEASNKVFNLSKKRS